MQIFSTPEQKLEKIFQEQSSAMHIYACSLVSDYQKAEDIIQEVFTSLLKKKLVPQKPRNYLLRAVRNQAFNLSRQPKESDLPSEVISWFSHPIEKDEEREKLTAALQSLPKEQREIVALKVWGEQTFREISEMMEISQNTVASRYRYAIENLQKAMQSYMKKEIS